MAPPVEPALRALWELAGAPAAAVRALERAGRVVQGFDPELEVAEQIAQAAVAPLLAAERGVGASALERVLAKWEGEAPGAEVPAPRLPRAPEVEGKVEEKVPAAPVRPSSRRVPREAPVRAAPVERPPRALDAGALERMAGPEVEAPRAGAPAPRPVRGAGPAVVSAVGARAALSRRAARAGAGDALHTPVRAEAPGAPATAAAEATAAQPTSAGAGGDAVAAEAAPAADRSRAAVPERRREETRRRLLARPIRPAAAAAAAAAAATMAAPAGGERRVSVEAARAALEKRAERAGATSGLQTPVTAEAEADRPALLARAQQARPAPSRAQVPPGAAKPVGSPALERALARTSRRVPRREVPAPASAAGASEAPLEGLAGLAARAPAAHRGPAPVSLAGTAPPQPPIPAVLAERLEEAQLARRLERILRREAEQAGVDLEELDP